MGNKRDNTRKFILEEAYKLFAEKGFNTVTMKDICDSTGLSRGGLYSHFSSTAEIFEGILTGIEANDDEDYRKGMKEGLPAAEILQASFEILRQEMNAKESSLSLAFYEYANTAGGKGIADFVTEGRQVWVDIIRYGINRGEFNEVEAEELANLLMFAYQGVRMWSRIIDVTPEMVDGILRNVARQLIGPTEK